MIMLGFLQYCCISPLSARMMSSFLQPFDCQSRMLVSPSCRCSGPRIPTKVFTGNTLSRVSGTAKSKCISNEKLGQGKNAQTVYSYASIDKAMRWDWWVPPPDMSEAGASDICLQLARGCSNQLWRHTPCHRMCQMQDFPGI